ncbi:MAG: hypothetical protein WKF31_10525 [Thermoleophilaceae bacterium]
MLIAAGLLLLGAAGGFTAGADARPSCRPAGARTVAATATVRVFAVRSGDVFACNIGNGRRLSLGDGPEVLRLKGPFVGAENA